MTKLLQPTSRLICFGSARALTQADESGRPEVDIGGPEFLA